jgi:predicted nucleic acid-binding protein
MTDGLAVVDSSALAALLFGEAAGAEVAARLEERSLAAPTLLRYEVASVGLKKLARYPRQSAALAEAFSLFERLDIRELPVPVAEVVSLAREVRLTVYDAAYLWLARSLDCELVTLDRKLARVSR